MFYKIALRKENSKREKIIETDVKYERNYCRIDKYPIYLYAAILITRRVKVYHMIHKTKLGNVCYKAV